jgi:hypothetical protein
MSPLLPALVLLLLWVKKSLKIRLDLPISISCINFRMAFGDTNGTQTSSKVLTFFVMTNLIIMIGLQFRIEYDNQINNDQACLRKLIFKNYNPDQAALPYKENSMKLVVGVFFSIVFTKFVILPNFPHLFEIGRLFDLMAVFNGIPILFIVTHDKMKTHSIKKIKKVLSLPIAMPIIELNV